VVAYLRQPARSSFDRNDQQDKENEPLRYVAPVHYRLQLWHPKMLTNMCAISRPLLNKHHQP
jgi:hypothetical protein